MTTDADLVAYSRDYAASAVATYPYRLPSLDIVTDWRVSARAKRRAAAVKHPTIPGAAVGDPLDWDAVVRDHGDRLPGPNSRFDDLRACHVVCSRRAADAYGEAEWRRVLRHELIHVEQFARFGATGHGTWFRERADAVNADRRCPAFHRGRYLIRCRGCGDVIADRCRRCRTTRTAELPVETQRERVAPTDCCGDYYELVDARADG
ncbi:SprT-like domain-containing protein [Halobaculum sp. CBA1158]|uniref:SprT-like domain-containing protein n=1 Tax=Halobaculum sp. CBA1158 TaxID=2904243 RepID=UPI001F38692F|nr:SprT-like domain-containing protein [Halobaculum sp. CBA1158]UIO98976.1 SprT-like domain-containing protein [Halobaculum sp. CBA1158]